MQTTIGLHEHSYALVPPQEFTTRMKELWTADYGLCSSQPLEKLWTIMAETFNSAIDDAVNGVQAPWRILQPATGSGKTTGACVFAAMQAQRNRASEGLQSSVGSVIVTRLIEDAEKIAKAINSYAGGAVAIAHHSSDPKSPDVLFSHDTIVIPHQAYLNASSARGSRWDSFMTWRGGERLLTIVDEALANVVTSYKVTSSDLAEVLRYITPDMEREFPTEQWALHVLKMNLDNHSQHASAEDGFSRGLWAEAINQGDVPLVDFGPLKLALRQVEFDRLGAKAEDGAARKRIRQCVEKTLDGSQALYDQWAYYAKTGGEHALHSAALAVPLDAPGPVVLDATARSDLLWDLFERRAQRIQTPSRVRSYRNVTLHVARTPGLGKRSMIANFPKRLPRLLAELEQRLGPDRSVFLCLHKGNRAPAAIFLPKKAAGQPSPFSVGHWGAVDGSNEWQNCDTAVIFGMPYRDQVWSTNTFFAFQGFKGDEWLADPKWKAHRNVHRAMRQRQLSVSIIQAIGRIRLRRVTDEHGNCPPADVFIVLPKDIDGDEVLKNIQADLPDLKVADWDFQMDGPKVRRPRKGSNAEALALHMEMCGPGTWSLRKVLGDIGIPGALKKIREDLNCPDSGLASRLAELGVTYQTEGRGRGAKSYLVKHQAA